MQWTEMLKLWFEYKRYRQLMCSQVFFSPDRLRETN